MINRSIDWHKMIFFWTENWSLCGFLFLHHLLLNIVVCCCLLTFGNLVLFRAEMIQSIDRQWWLFLLTFFRPDSQQINQLNDWQGFFVLDCCSSFLHKSISRLINNQNNCKMKVLQLTWCCCQIKGFTQRKTENKTSCCIFCYINS